MLSLWEPIEVAAGRRAQGNPLIGNLIKRIGKGDMSCKQAVGVARDAKKSGAQGARLDEFLSCGSDLKHEQNLERDIYTQCVNRLGLPDIICVVDTIIRKTNGAGVVEVKRPVLLPHEVFGLLYEKNRAQFHSVLNTSQNVSYWTESFKNEPPWLRLHPMREHILGHMNEVTPLRVFGDETGISKNCERPVACLSWDSDISTGDVWLSKFPVYIIPQHLLLPAGASTDPLDAKCVWSLNCLSKGVWPSEDHNGVPFPRKSWRGKRAGKPLTGDNRCCALAATAADWAWNDKT